MTPAAAPRTGQAKLTVRRVAGASAAVTASATSPMLLRLPQPRGPSVWACLGNLGGGYVGGDCTHLSLVVEDRAHCYLGTQASGKVYRNPAGHACGHETQAQVGAEALLVFAPDALQAFAGSSFRQRQRFDLAPGAALVLVDWLTGGRTARGERWSLRQIETRNEIWTTPVADPCGPTRLALRDVLRLDGADDLRPATQVMGRYQNLATVILWGPPLAPAAAAVVERLASRPIPQRSEVVVSASPLSGGALVRIAAETIEQVRHELDALLCFLPDLLGDDPRAHTS